ncbi:MAG: hypothetical protein K6E18_09345 [Lachnospiraceae bacterium]|nr:hypothetical protein [Lachnospiraceae bacterium]
MLQPIRLISDGCIFQRNKEIRICGAADCEQVRAKLSDGKSVLEEAQADVKEGRFTLLFSKRRAGGPYSLKICGGADTVTVSDVYIGDVIQLVGQSNIEFPMSRVSETYPEEFEAPDEPLIRSFKIVERREFHTPLSDMETGAWLPVKADTLPDFSAVGYFMAKKLLAETGVAVGLIDTTLGGSAIESWMSREMLEAFPEQLGVVEPYLDEAYLAGVLAKNEENTNAWHTWVDAHDAGLLEKWYQEEQGKDADWEEITLPCIFQRHPKLKGFTGSIWFRRSFQIEADRAGEKALLWFGTMTDGDEIFINGVSVGKTEYCYPPRRYEIPAGLLKEGENVITIRLLVEKGCGRVTDGKVYGILYGNGKRSTDGFTESAEGYDIVGLSGKWTYRIGTVSEKIEPVDFVSWKPTALYNGMLHPCTQFSIGGIFFYQGESNLLATDIYEKEFRTLVDGYRKLWRDDDLPFVYVLLPQFDLVTYEPDGTDESNTHWEDMQACQRACSDIPFAYLAEAAETGEINDLHPQRKKEIGELAAGYLEKHLTN